MRSLRWDLLSIDRPVPHDRFALAVPKTCVQCGASGTVQLQQILRAATILLNWSCVRCGEEFPIAEPVETREELRDMSRAISRKMY